MSSVDTRSDEKDSISCRTAYTEATFVFPSDPVNLNQIMKPHDQFFRTKCFTKVTGTSKMYRAPQLALQRVSPEISSSGYGCEV